MTEPTRDARHAATLAFLADERVRLFAGTTTRPDALTGDAKMMQDIIADAKAKRDAVLAYAAECVKRVPELEAEVASHTAYKLSLLDALGPGVPEDEGRSIPDAIRALRAEVERLRAKAAIVDALERGEIELHRADLHAPGEPRTQWVCLNTTTHFGYRGTTARDALAAYAAATREGTDA